MAEPWWKSAVIYQIYPRSFADANGDGVGDLEGIRAHLDHLAWLGVDAIWLSPIFPSPMADFGYDVADYCDIEPLFGDLAAFDRLLADAHERGLRVLLDWVPNHSSDQHPWFLESASDRTNPKHDWYLWRDGDPGTPPNNWTAHFTGGPAWTWVEARQQWYLHSFLAEQPDLNWGNPVVRAAMHDTLRFWLDRGVDGFRIDVVHLLGKDPALPDNPPTYQGAAMMGDHPDVHGYLREIRSLLDSYDGDRVTVGEVYILSTARVAEYYGAGDELHLAFNFPPLYAPWEAGAWRTRVQRVIDEMDPRQAWPTWVLSNHDNPRHRTRYGTEARARAAAVLLLGLRGTPFLYAGEELGLEDAVIPPDRIVDPGGRDGCRAPIPWDASEEHGWGSANPWLPWPPESDRRNTEALRADKDSILHLYHGLLAARRRSSALGTGTLRLLDAPDGVLAWSRHAEGDQRVVMVNFTDHAIPAPPPSAQPGPGWSIEISSDGRGEGQPFAGRLDPDQAVILMPGG